MLYIKLIYINANLKKVIKKVKLGDVLKCKT